MGHGINLHTNDGIIAQTPGVGISLAAGATVPTDGTAGYAPGCTFWQTDGNSDTTYQYVNVGTRTSCNFDPVLVPTNVVATGAELNRVADVSTRIVNVTASTLTVTVDEHDGKIIELDRAAGIAVTLPSLAAAKGARFEFWVGTTFTGAASIKSVASGDIMVGHATMGNNSDVDFQATAADTFDTIDLFGTANSTGGIEGQKIVIIGGTGRWFVEIQGDAAGTEATPFQNTVS